MDRGTTYGEALLVLFVLLMGVIYAIFQLV
jgi:hypothetical protein